MVDRLSSFRSISSNSLLSIILKIAIVATLITIIITPASPVSAELLFNCETEPNNEIFVSGHNTREDIRITDATNCNITVINSVALRLHIQGTISGSSVKVRNFTCLASSLLRCVYFAGAINNGDYIDIEDVHHQHVSPGTGSPYPCVAYFASVITGTKIIRLVNLQLSGHCEGNMCQMAIVQFAQSIVQVPKLVIRNLIATDFYSMVSNQVASEIRAHGALFGNVLSNIEDVLIEDICISSLQLLPSQAIANLYGVRFIGQSGINTGSELGTRFIIRNVTLDNITLHSTFVPTAAGWVHSVEGVRFATISGYETISISDINLQFVDVVLPARNSLGLFGVALTGPIIGVNDINAAVVSSLVVSNVSIKQLSVEGRDGKVTVAAVSVQNSHTGYPDISYRSLTLSHLQIFLDTLEPATENIIAAISTTNSGIFTPVRQNTNVNPSPNTATFAVDDISISHITLRAYTNSLRGMILNDNAELKDFYTLSFTNFRLESVLIRDETGATTDSGDSSISLLDGKRISGFRRGGPGGTNVGRLIISDFSQQHVICTSLGARAVVRNFHYVADATDTYFRNFNSITFENHLLQNITVTSSKSDANNRGEVEAVYIDTDIVPEGGSTPMSSNASVIFRNVVIDQIDCTIPTSVIATCRVRALETTKQFAGLQKISFEDFFISNVDIDVPSNSAPTPSVFHLHITSGGFQSLSNSVFDQETSLVMNNASMSKVTISSNVGATVSTFRLAGTSRTIRNFAAVQFSNFLYEDIRINDDDKKRTSSGAAFFAPIYVESIDAFGTNEEATTGRSVLVDNVVARRVKVFTQGTNAVGCVLFEAIKSLTKYSRVVFRDLIMEDSVKCGFQEDDGGSVVGSGAEVKVFAVALAEDLEMNTLNVATVESLSQNEETRPMVRFENILFSDVEARSTGTTATIVRAVSISQSIKQFPLVEFKNIRMEKMFVTGRSTVDVASVAIGYAITLRRDVPSLNGFLLQNLTLDSIECISDGDALDGMLTALNAHDIGGANGYIDQAYNVTIDRIHFKNINFTCTHPTGGRIYIMATWLDTGLAAPPTNIVAPTSFVANDVRFEGVVARARSKIAIIQSYLGTRITNFMSVVVSNYHMENIEAVGVLDVDIKAFNVGTISMSSSVLQAPMDANTQRFEFKSEEMTMRNVVSTGGSYLVEIVLLHLLRLNNAGINGYAYVDLNTYLMDNISLVQLDSDQSTSRRINAFFFNSANGAPSVVGHAYPPSSSLPASYFRVKNAHLKTIFFQHTAAPAALFVYESHGIDGGFTTIEFDDLRLENASLFSRQQPPISTTQVRVFNFIGTSVITFDNTKLACQRKFSITNSAIDGLSLMQQYETARQVPVTIFFLAGTLANMASIELKNLAILNVEILRNDSSTSTSNNSNNIGLHMIIFEHTNADGLSASAVYDKNTADPNTRCGFTYFTVEDLEISNISSQEEESTLATSWKLQMIALAGPLVDFNRIRLEDIQASHVSVSFAHSNGNNPFLEILLFDFTQNVMMVENLLNDMVDIRYFTVKSLSISDIDFHGTSTFINCFKFRETPIFMRYTEILFRSVELRRVLFNVSAIVAITAVEIETKTVQPNGLSALDDLSSFVVSDISLSDVTVISSSTNFNDHGIFIAGFYSKAMADFYNVIVQNIILQSLFVSSVAPGIQVVGWSVDGTPATDEIVAPASPFKSPPTFTVQNIKVSNSNLRTLSVPSQEIQLFAANVLLKIANYARVVFRDLVIVKGTRIESKVAVLVIPLFASSFTSATIANTNSDVSDLVRSISFRNIIINDLVAVAVDDVRVYNVRMTSDQGVSGFTTVSFSTIETTNLRITCVNGSQMGLVIRNVYPKGITGGVFGAAALMTTNLDPAVNLDLAKIEALKPALLVSGLVIRNIEMDLGNDGANAGFNLALAHFDQACTGFWKVSLEDFTIQNIIIVSNNGRSPASTTGVATGGILFGSSLNAITLPDSMSAAWKMYRDVYPISFSSKSFFFDNIGLAVTNGNPSFGCVDFRDLVQGFDDFNVDSIVASNVHLSSLSEKASFSLVSSATSLGIRASSQADEDKNVYSSFTADNLVFRDSSVIAVGSEGPVLLKLQHLLAGFRDVSITNIRMESLTVLVDSNNDALFITGVYLQNGLEYFGGVADDDAAEPKVLISNVHLRNVSARCLSNCTDFEFHAVSLFRGSIRIYDQTSMEHLSIINSTISSASTSLTNLLSVSLFTTNNVAIYGKDFLSSVFAISDLVISNVNVQSSCPTDIEPVVIIRKGLDTFSQVAFRGIIVEHLTLQSTAQARVLSITMNRNAVSARNLLVSNCSISHLVVRTSDDHIVLIKVFDASVSFSHNSVFDSLNINNVFIASAESATIRSIHFTSNDPGSVVPFSHISISNCFISRVQCYSSGIVRAMIIIINHPVIARTNLQPQENKSSILFDNLKIEHLLLHSEGPTNAVNTAADDGSDIFSTTFRSSTVFREVSHFMARNLRQSNITIVSLTYSTPICVALLYNRVAGFDVKESIELEGFKMDSINVFTSSSATALNRPSSINVSFAAIRLIAARTFNMSNMEVDLSQVLPMKEETGKETKVPRFTFLEFFDRDEAPTSNLPISMTLENNIIRSINIPSSSSSSAATFFRLSSSWMPPFSNLSFIHNDILLPSNEAATNKRVLPIIFFEFTPFNQITPPSPPATIVFDNNSLFTSTETHIISTSYFVDQTPTKLADVFLNCNNRWIGSVERATKQRVSSIAIEFPNMNCPATASPSVSSSTSYSHNTSEITPPRTLSKSLDGTISNNTPSHTSSFPTHTITPPIPPRKKVVDAIPSEAKLVGNIFGAISGPMGAMTTRKIMSIAGMADCGKEEITDEGIPDVDDIDTNPMRLKLGSSRFSSHRGSIFGSVIFCICWLLMMFFFAFLRSKVDTGCSLSRAMRKIGIPGTVAVPAFSLFPVAVNSGAKIAKRYYIDEKFDIFVLIFASTMTIIVPIMALVWICYEVRKHEILKLPNATEKKGRSTTSFVPLNLLADDLNNQANNNNTNITEEELRDIEAFVKDASTDKPPKWKIWLDYFTEPVFVYKRSKFSDKYGPAFDNAISPIFILLLFIFAIIGEIGEGYASLCDQNDYVCCQSGVLIVAGSAVLDFLLIVIFFLASNYRSPFLVRLEKWFFPVVSLIGVINTFLIVLSFFTGQRNSDGVNSVDFTDVLTITTEIAFYITIVVTVAGVANEVFSGATYEFYSSWKAKRDVKKYEKQAQHRLQDLDEELDEVLLTEKNKKSKNRSSTAHHADKKRHSGSSSEDAKKEEHDQKQKRHNDRHSSAAKEKEISGHTSSRNEKEKKASQQKRHHESKQPPVANGNNKSISSPKVKNPTENRAPTKNTEVDDDRDLQERVLKKKDERTRSSSHRRHDNPSSAAEQQNLKNTAPGSSTTNKRSSKAPEEKKPKNPVSSSSKREEENKKRSSSSSKINSDSNNNKPRSSSSKKKPEDSRTRDRDDNNRHRESERRSNKSINKDKL